MNKTLLLEHFLDIGQSFYVIYKALTFVWQTTRWWTIAWGLQTMIQGLLPAASIYLTKDVVDSLVAAMGEVDNPALIAPLITNILLFGSVIFLGFIMGGVRRWIQENQQLRLDDHIQKVIQAKAATLDLTFFDSATYYDLLYRANSHGLYAPAQLVTSLGLLVQRAVALISLATLLLAYGWFVPCLLILITLPGLFLVSRHTSQFHRWREDTTYERRRSNYYHTLITAREPAPEVRLFKLTHHFHYQWQQIRTKLRTEHLQWVSKQLWIDIGLACIAIIGIGTAGVYLGGQALTGILSLGDLALIAQAFDQGHTILSTFTAQIGNLHRLTLRLKNLFEFLELKSTLPDTRLGDPLPAIHKTISFQNVSFAYPNSERQVFTDFNVTFPVGQFIAIVGHNGAGKSTLAKLLCRFYDVDAGRITLDGHDIRGYSLDSLRQSISIIFQTPVRYLDTTANNIAYGAWHEEPNNDAIHAAAISAQAHTFIQHLPQQYDTLLGKEFGGEDLSGGEWQRIALARALVRDASVVILDEPTSAMDPWSRKRWIQSLKETMQGRTTILITHRFTTAQEADLVYVMKNGQIVEEGTHDDLMANDGSYRQLWQTQNNGDVELPA